MVILTLHSSLVYIFFFISFQSSAGDSAFSYIDVWSSNYTWGGAAPPAAGEFVVIPAGMTLLLDTDTPVLSFLLIQGGQLIFDEKDIELQANIIMITDGGLLQVCACTKVI